MTLNREQELAVDEIYKWSMNDEESLCLIGIAGSGKSTVLTHAFNRDNFSRIQNKYLKGEDQRVDVIFTATTHKAVSVLSTIALSNGMFSPNYSVRGTIYSFMGTRYDPIKDEMISSNRTPILSDKTVYILVIDEASLLNHSMMEYITGWQKSNNVLSDNGPKVKILYVGDKYQLPPVKGKVIPAFSLGYREIHLNEIERTNDPVLQDWYLGSRSQVKDAPNWEVDKEPAILGKYEFDKLLETAFKNDPENSVVLTYTNKCTNEYNKRIQDIRGESVGYKPGSVFISNDVTMPIIWKHYNRSRAIHNGERVVISETPRRFKASNLQSKYRYLDAIRLNGEIFYVADPEFRRKELYRLNKAVEANTVIGMKEHLQDYKLHVADLRPGYAMTIHRSQGSSYDYVFIDLKDLNRCTDKDLRARLLYVAISRARKNVYFLGD